MQAVDLRGAEFLFQLLDEPLPGRSDGALVLAGPGFSDVPAGVLGNRLEELAVLAWESDAFDGRPLVWASVRE
jgi:hypothetical protein